MKKYYAYVLPPGVHRARLEQGVVEGWNACESLVKGAAGARYRGFSTRDAAEQWLKDGARYDIKKKYAALQPGIYFDAGTGRGYGVEVLVTDEKGTGLLAHVMHKNQLTQFGTFRIQDADATNNYGELLGCRYALEIARARGVKKIFGDSKLVVSYWSRGIMREQKLPSKTKELIEKVSGLRKKFEEIGGEVGRVSGDDNPADLGFHR
ncbi:MAG: ribonuclease H family protein [Candidatus Sungbacteria bacterium]|nr:ribonuclease H family protein [Candidatus Sungbacteria bacterium]